MGILIVTTSTFTEGPQVVFDCPRCKAQGVSAKTQETEEKGLAYNLVPVFKSRYTDLTCNGCGKSFRLDQPLDAVAALAPEEISKRVRKRIPVFIKFSIGIGIALPLIVLLAFGGAGTGAPFTAIIGTTVFSLVSLLGFIFSAIGLAATIGKRSWWRLASFIGLAPFLVSITVMLVTHAVGKPDRSPTRVPPGPRHGFQMKAPALSLSPMSRPAAGEKMRVGT